MHEIAGKHCSYALRSQSDGYVPRGVARRRLQPHFAIEFIIHIDKHSPTSLDDWQYIVLIGPFVGIAGGRLCGLELAPRHDVAGVGECRHPTPVHQSCVPAAMVDMKMGAQHIVDLLGSNTCIRQPLQKGAVIAAMPMREVCARLVVANATVDQNGMAPGTNQKTLDGKNKPAGCRRYQSGPKPMKMRFECFVGAVRESFRWGQQRVAHLQNSGDPDIPDSPIIH